MIIKLLKQHPKKTLLLCGVLLFVIGAYFHITNNFSVYRLYRAISLFVFLLFAFLLKEKNESSLIHLFLLLFAISSVASIWFENKNIAISVLIFNFFAYVSLGLFAYKKIIKKRISTLYYIVFSILILVNAYLLYEFINVVKNVTHQGVFYSLLYFNILAMVFMSFTTLLYNHSRSSDRSITFTIACFLFIFAEVFRAIGYYNIAYGSVSVHIARFLIISAAGLLVYYFTLKDDTNVETLEDFL